MQKFQRIGRSAGIMGGKPGIIIGVLHECSNPSNNAP